MYKKVWHQRPAGAILISLKSACWNATLRDQAPDYVFVNVLCEDLKRVRGQVERKGGSFWNGSRWRLNFLGFTEKVKPQVGIKIQWKPLWQTLRKYMLLWSIYPGQLWKSDSSLAPRHFRLKIKAPITSFHLFDLTSRSLHINMKVNIAYSPHTLSHPTLPLAIWAMDGASLAHDRVRLYQIGAWLAGRVCRWRCALSLSFSFPLSLSWRQCPAPQPVMGSDVHIRAMWVKAPDVQPAASMCSSLFNLLWSRPDEAP